MWSVNKVEIYYAKIGFMDCKWSNLNAQWSYTPWCYSLLGSILGCPFHSMQEKGNAACGLLIKWKFILQKQVSWTANGPIRMPQGHTPLGVTHFWGPLWGALFSACRKREMLHVVGNKVEIYFSEIGFVDSNWSNLNAQGSYTPWCHSLLGSAVRCPFLCLREKGNARVGEKSI